MLTGAADRLETALRGGAVDPGAVDDLDTATELRDLGRLLVPLGPAPAFVNALYERLLDQPPVVAPETSTAQTFERPRVVTVSGGRGRGLRIAVAGAVGLLALAGVVGVAGRSALPGQPLYAARQVVDRAGVALGGSEQGRGLRLLTVAEHHVDDALELASAPSRSTADLRTSLTDAWSATQEADQALLSDFAARTDPLSLTAIDAFAGRVLASTDSLARSAPDVADTVAVFRSGVVAMRDQALRLLSACTVCGAATDAARQQLGTLTPTTGPTTAAGPAASTGTTSATTTSSGGPSIPTLVATTGVAPGGTAPSVTSRGPTDTTNSSGAPAPTTGGGGGTGGGVGPAGPTNPVSPSQGSSPGSTPSSSASSGSSGSSPALPAPTSLLPTLPTLSPTLGVSATATLGGVTPTVPLP